MLIRRINQSAISFLLNKCCSSVKNMVYCFDHSDASGILVFSYYNKSRVYTSAKSRARFTRKIAYYVIIVGSVSILKINIWIYVFEVINVIKHSVCKITSMCLFGVNWFLPTFSICGRFKDNKFSGNHIRVTILIFILGLGCNLFVNLVQIYHLYIREIYYNIPIY
jgi:hypothetical protein